MDKELKDYLLNNVHLQDVIKNAKAAKYKFVDANTMENDKLRIVFDVTTKSEWTTELDYSCINKATGRKEPMSLFPFEAKIERHLLGAIRENLPKRHTAEDCLKEITAVLQTLRAAMAETTTD